MRWIRRYTERAGRGRADRLDGRDVRHTAGQAALRACGRAGEGVGLGFLTELARAGFVLPADHPSLSLAGADASMVDGVGEGLTA